jgi:hypothetical protein
MDTNQMPAGREMDALVAEKIMGWAKHPHTDSPTFWWEGPTKSYLIGDLPHYSTDISNAWEVLEEMQSGIFSARQRFYQALNEQVDIQAGLPMGQHVAWPAALGMLCKVMPLAICRAALVSLRPGGRHVNIRREIAKLGGSET